MNTILKKYKFLTIALLSVVLLFSFVSISFAAGTTTPVSEYPICGLGKDAQPDALCRIKSAQCNPPAGLLKDVTYACYNCGSCTLCDILQIFVTVATRMFAVAGGLALIFFIWGGIEMIMSQGSSDMVQKGKSKLTGSVIGMMIMLFSWVGVGTVIGVLQSGEAKDVSTATTVFEGSALAQTIKWYQLPKCAQFGKSLSGNTEEKGAGCCIEKKSDGSVSCTSITDPRRCSNSYTSSSCGTLSQCNTGLANIGCCETTNFCKDSISSSVCYAYGGLYQGWTDGKKCSEVSACNNKSIQ